MSVFYWPFNRFAMKMSRRIQIQTLICHDHKQDTSKLLCNGSYTHTTTHQLTSSHEDTRKKEAAGRNRRSSTAIYCISCVQRNKGSDQSDHHIVRVRNSFRPLSDPSSCGQEQVFALGTCILVFLFNKSNRAQPIAHYTLQQPCQFETRQPLVTP